MRTRSSRDAGVCCSTVRKNGSAESRGLRPVDNEQPTLREQFEAQKQQGERAMAALFDLAHQAVGSRRRRCAHHCICSAWLGVEASELHHVAGSIVHISTQVSLHVAGIPGDAVSQAPDSPLSLQAAAVSAAARGRDGGGSSGSPIKTTGLRRTPLTGGVHNASQQYDLPSPAVAVRNLVSDKSNTEVTDTQRILQKILMGTSCCRQWPCAIW